MKHKYEVVDGDGHVMESREVWETYLDKKFRSRVVLNKDTENKTWGSLEIDGVSIYRKYPESLVRRFDLQVKENWSKPYQAGFDSSSQLAAMDEQGIKIMYLYPSLFLSATAIEGQDKDLTAALLRAYNDWLVEFCSLDNKRLRPVGLIGLQYPDVAATEVARLAKNYNIRNITIRPNPISGKTIADKSLFEFWRTCSEYDVAIGIHEGAHCQLEATGINRFYSHFAIHTCCHPMEQMMAFVALLEGGIFEEFKNTRVAFLEAGCSWVPYLLWRMDGEFKKYDHDIPQVKRKPSEYFSKHCYVHCEGSEPCLNEVIQTISADRLLFASDYPHPDHKMHEEIEEIEEADISSDVKKKILESNALNFYNS